MCEVFRVEAFDEQAVWVIVEIVFHAFILPISAQDAVVVILLPKEAMVAVIA